MAFSSLLFLFGFLPIVLLVYLLVPIRHKNVWLLFASGAFYFWGAPRFLPCVLATSLLDYLVSQKLGNERTKYRQLLLSITICLNVFILLYFKYSNFFIGELNAYLQDHGLEAFRWTAIALPIGISFITFEKISYLVDVYRRVVRPAPSFVTYLLFLALFPHLIAGPIFRYHDIAEQLTKRETNWEDIREGIQRFIIGLAKKVLIADAMAEVANSVFQLRNNDLTTGYAWLGALAYTFQIYFDFSGYSDMAIGLGRMLGFRFLENFNYPYISRSITEFWRRWHISLSNWMKEYLYIPLGGNQKGAFRTYLNLWIVFLVSGFWHGANWTFLVWGLFHGTLLVSERLFLQTFLARLPAFLSNAWTFLLVVLSWVIFRADSLSEAGDYLLKMFAPILGIRPVEGPLLSELLNYRQTFFFGIAIVLTILPRLMSPERLEIAWTRVLEKSATAAACNVFLLYLFYLSVLRLVNSHFHPFIYFRF